MEPTSDNPDAGYDQPRERDGTVPADQGQAVQGSGAREGTLHFEVGHGFHVESFESSDGTRILHVYDRGTHLGIYVCPVGGRGYWEPSLFNTDG